MWLPISPYSVIVTLVVSCTVSGDFCSFYVLLTVPHPYSTLILGVFPLHQIAHFGASVRIGLKLFGREIIFEVFQPMWSRYLNVTDRQTTCNLITALCVASPCKKQSHSMGNRNVDPAALKFSSAIVSKQVNTLQFVVLLLYISPVYAEAQVTLR